MSDDYLQTAIDITEIAIGELVNWDPNDHEGFLRRAVEAVSLINVLKSQQGEK